MGFKTRSTPTVVEDVSQAPAPEAPEAQREAQEVAEGQAPQTPGGGKCPLRQKEIERGCFFNGVPSGELT